MRSTSLWRNALLLSVLMAPGITQPGGAGTTIFIYDDSTGGPYPFAGIAATFPADFIDTLSTSGAEYRSKVDVQVGDTGVGTATTTLIDTQNSTVHFDLGKTLKSRGTQTTAWNFQLGTKIGSGNIAAGTRGTTLVFGAATSLSGIHAWYGCLIRTISGAMTFSTATDGVGEMISCLLQSTDAAGTKPINIGNATNRFANTYNTHLSHATAAQISSNYGTLASERMVWAAAAPSRFLTVNAGNLALKDSLFIGSPTSADMAWGGVNAVNWRLYRPTWSGNAPKFVPVSSSIPQLDGVSETMEFRRATFKIVDRNGIGVGAIPFKLTDQFGTIIVAGSSNGNGEIAFGAGVATNMVPVMDHYAVGTAYTQRHRSPFTIKCNTPDLSGYNSNYLQRTYKFLWPGYESITLSSGAFEDLGEIIPIEEQSGGPTMWVELTSP
jgi:hypothetical protein